MPLGTLTQTASAFGSAQESLSFFATVYRTVAEWAAIIERLSGFNRSLDNAKAMHAASQITVSSDAAAKSVRI